MKRVSFVLIVLVGCSMCAIIYNQEEDPKEEVRQYSRITYEFLGGDTVMYSTDLPFSNKKGKHLVLTMSFIYDINQNGFMENLSVSESSGYPEFDRFLISRLNGGKARRFPRKLDNSYEQSIYYEVY